MGGGCEWCAEGGVRAVRIWGEGVNGVRKEELEL